MNFFKNIRRVCFFVQASLFMIAQSQTHAGKIIYVNVKGEQLSFIQVGCPRDSETGQRISEPWCTPPNRSMGDTSFQGGSTHGGGNGNSSSFNASMSSSCSGDFQSGLNSFAHSSGNASQYSATLESAAQIIGLATGILSAHTQQKAITQARQGEMMQQANNHLTAQQAQHEQKFGMMRAEIQNQSQKLESGFKTIVQSCVQAERDLCGLDDLLNGIQVSSANQSAARAQVRPVQVNDRTFETVALARANEAQVKHNVNQANRILPLVISQMEPAASEYIREQLRSSQAMARDAIELAQVGAPAGTIQLLGDFAINTAASVGTFLGGVLAGNYEGFLNAGQVAQAIYNNPNLILNLSTRIMNTITAGPGAIATAAYDAFQLARNALYQFEVEMAYGDARQRGHALGELGANVLLAMAGTEVSAPLARAALGSMAVRMAEAQATEVLGHALNQLVRTSEALAPEMATIDNSIREIADSAGRLGIRDRGGLNSFVNFFRRVTGQAGGSAERVERIIESARNVNPTLGNKHVRELPDLTGTFKEAFEGHIFKGNYEPGEIVFQVQRTGQARPGNWFAPVKPINAQHADELLNVRVWGNDAGQIKVFKIKERVSGYAGKVAGGEGHQFFIPRDVPLEEVLEEIVF